MLQVIDPIGVERRTRYRLKRRVYNVPGPNYLWHADGHDKLKRFGFPIYGCIDGFSKKVLWIDVATSNNDPTIIAYFYLAAVKKFKLLPTLLRTDHGTECGLMEDIHMALRSDHGDEHAGVKSFLRGKSTHNQRIESYWRQFRQHVGDFYIILFKVMENDNLLDLSNPVHIECLQYCFAGLVQREITATKKEWNEHRIRKQNCANVVGGIPNEVYHCPENVGGRDCRQTVDEEVIQILLDKYAKKPVLYSDNIRELVNIAAPNASAPVTAEDAFNLYITMIDLMNRETV